MAVDEEEQHGRRQSRGSDAANADAAALERMGHKQELKRSFSLLSMLGLAFAILNTWTALAASINLALPAGGSSSVILGLLVAGICNLCLAASLGEFLSAYPTAGGQYHWAAIVSPPSMSTGISYVTGYINVFGWLALSATGGLLSSTFILNVATLYHESYTPEPWHQFLIYIATTVVALLINAFLTHLLPYLTKAAFFWSLTGFAVISITILSCAAPNFQSGKFVYTNFINNTGWPDGLAWMLGLLQGAFALTGFDATAHMIEEIPEPHIQGPRILIYCIGVGMFTGFVFLSCLFFCVTDVDRVISSPIGPLLEVFMQATGSRVGSTCLLMFPLGCVFLALSAIMATSSRMSYAFARDRGLPFSGTLSKVHPTLQLPLNALLWTTGWVFVFGCIFLGSSATFNAITSASVVALGLTYAIPPFINVCSGRKALPSDRAFALPGPMGWICNIVGILYTILTTVLFLFPGTLPVTSTNMNYSVVAFGIMFLIAGGTWFVVRHQYHGPVVELHGSSGEVIQGFNPVEEGKATAHMEEFVNGSGTERTEHKE